MVDCARKRSEPGAALPSRRRVLLGIDPQPSQHGFRDGQGGEGAYPGARLQAGPEHPFPAALDDAVAAVEHLLAIGIPADRIAIGGDSAGGGLTLATLIRLRDAGRPLPGCAWLVSPRVDLEMTGASIDTKDADDPLIHRAYLQELASAYCGKESPHNPLISPVHADLSGLPPALVQVGSAETLLDDAVSIVERFGEADIATTLEIWPRMIHAWHLWSARLTAGRQAIASAGAYIDARLAK